MSNKIQKDSLIDHILLWFKKDLTIILICLICLAACVYTILTVEAYQDRINDHWEEQWELNCDQLTHENKPIRANVTFNLGGKYKDAATQSIN